MNIIINLDIDNLQKEALLRYILKDQSINKTALKSIIVNFSH